MRTVIWRHFSIAVPDDWEMLQFSRNSEAGRCAFADRYQFRLELNWKVVPGEPDFTRMIRDYRTRLEEAPEVSSTKEVRHRGWYGIDSFGEKVLNSRFGRFFEEESCLLEIVFVWTEGKDRNLVEEVLDGVQAQPAIDGQLVRWKAFGMDLLASKDLDLSQCQVETALAKIEFSDKRRIRSESFERLGMVSEWLNVTVEEWLKWRSGALLEVCTESTSVNGHEIVTLHGTVKVKRWPLPGSRKIVRKASAWICPEDGRLYYASIAPAEEMDIAGARLGCCENLTLNR